MLLTIPQLWIRAQLCVRKVVAESDFLQPPNLQHALTGEIEARLMKELCDTSSRYQLTVLAALNTPQCSAYLTAIPSLPVYRVSDASMQLAVRHRLGLVPFTSLAEQKCGHCVDDATQSNTFRVDPDHFHSCKDFTHTTVLQRHNNIMQVLMDLGVAAGFIATREPNDHVRPAGQAQPGMRNFNAHADILFQRHDTRLYVDVTVTRPTAASALLLDKNKSFAQLALRQSNKRALVKHSMYDDIAAVNGYTMVPFVMETYGALGAEAHALLKLFARHVTEFKPRAFLRHAYTRLSVALQSGNALIAENGVHMLRLSEQRDYGAHSPSRARSSLGLRGSTGATAQQMAVRRVTVESRITAADELRRLSDGLPPTQAMYDTVWQAQRVGRPYLTVAPAAPLVLVPTSVPVLPLARTSGMMHPSRVLPMSCWRAPAVIAAPVVAAVFGTGA